MSTNRLIAMVIMVTTKNEKEEILLKQPEQS